MPRKKKRTTSLKGKQRIMGPDGKWHWVESGQQGVSATINEETNKLIERNPNYIPIRSTRETLYASGRTSVEVVTYPNNQENK